MMPIQSQRDQYAVFGPPQTSRMAGEGRSPLPDREVVADLLKGPRVGTGQLNPRGIEEPGHRIGQRLAVDTSHMDPASHAYHEMPTAKPDPAEGWMRDEGGHWEAPEHFERAEEEADPLIDEDDASGYNWGPEPSFDPGASPGPHPDFHGDAPHPVGTPVYNPGGGYDTHTGSRLGFNRRTADGGPGDSGEDLNGSTSYYGGGVFNPMLFYPGQHLDPRSMMLGEGGQEGEFAGHGEVPTRWPTAASSTERVAHGYYPSHRVGLPYKDTIIPGTVTHLDGQNVGIRWDDGQHSSENPLDLQPL